MPFLVAAAVLALLVPGGAALLHYGSGQRETSSTNTSQPYVAHARDRADQSAFRAHDKCVDAEEACLPPDAPPVLPLNGVVIVLDAGHGGSDAGAIRDGVNEKDINLQVTLKLRDALVKQGAIVILTRDDDSALTLSERVDFISRNKPTLFLSIHTNAHTRSAINGIEAYYHNDASLTLAQSIYQAVVDGLGERGNWVRKRELAVVHHELAPSALIEIGYLSNDTNRSFLVTDEYQLKIADSIYKGILDFVSTRKSNSGKPDNKPGESESLAPASPASTPDTGKVSASGQNTR